MVPSGERYELYDEIARGGMATVHLGRQLGAVGFSRLVAIKRMHRHLALDPAFVAMFVDEARLTSHVQHPNVVSTLDVVHTEGELLLIMELINGLSLSRLRTLSQRREAPVPLDIASSILVGALSGLHAAHEARDEQGHWLEIVHRDVSPQNVLVGVDGVARIIDFGIAKAASRATVTQEGSIKGKLRYMAPEQLIDERLDRRTDVFAAGVVLWELLASRPLFASDNVPAVGWKILEGTIDPPSAHRAEVPPALDAVVLRALSREAGDRFPTARDFALSLEEAYPPASALRVGTWLEGVAGDELAKLSADARGPDPSQATGSLLTFASTGLLSSGHQPKIAGLPLADEATAVAPRHSPRRPSEHEIEASSMATPRVARPRARSWLALGGGLLALLVLARSGWSLRADVPVAPASALSSGSEVDATPSNPAPTVTASTEPRGEGDVESVEPPAAVPTVSAERPSPRRPVPAARPAPKRPAPPPMANCNPPYYIEGGKKHFKPQCF